EHAHAGAGTTAEGVGDLETLQAVAALGLATHDIEDLVDELSALGVVAPGQLLPAPDCPKTKLSGRMRAPNGPARTASMVPGSRSTRTVRGTYLLPEA
ncbi:hypothetical protein LTR33_003454, partial [Friedmanniomyces endolithicus]